MKDEHKAKKQLIDELVELRRQITEMKVKESEIRKAEEVLKKSEEQYRDLFESANDLIQIVTIDGRFLHVNRAWRETLGYNEEEIVNLIFV